MDYQKIVDEYMSENGKSLNSVEQGRRFLDFVLLKLFGRTETELDNNDLNEGVLFTDGAKDYGIDCSFIDGDVLYLIQGKYRSEHSYANVYHYIQQIKDFFNLSDARQLRKSLVDVYNALNNTNINKIKVYYMTNNFLNSEAENHNYDNLCQDFNRIYSEKLEKLVSMEIIGFEGYKRIHTGILLELPWEIKKSTQNLYLARHFENRDKTTIVAEVALKELARLVERHKNYIFFSNIRNYKGLNVINKGIKETYEKQPKNFWYYNNGITIVCSDYEFISDSSVRVKAPQIVNGCQTATTIYDCWNKSPDKENIDGTILVKIIKDLHSSKRKDITKYTNSQTAVSGKDFFALESFHKDLQVNFKELGYFYEIQSYSANALTIHYKGCAKYKHLFDTKFKKRNVLFAKEITQTYVAVILKMPAKAKNIGQFMPGCDKYEMVFNDSTPTNPIFYLLPYGIWYYFKKVYQLPQNNVIDKDKWSTSLLFISYVFFEIINKKYNTNNFEFNSIDFMNLCDEKIQNVEEFDKIANMTFNVIKDFYSDSYIKEIIGDNLPKFLKSTIENNTRVYDILMDKINNVI